MQQGVRVYQEIQAFDRKAVPRSELSGVRLSWPNPKANWQSVMSKVAIKRQQNECKRALPAREAEPLIIDTSFGGGCSRLFCNVRELLPDINNWLGKYWSRAVAARPLEGDI